ncbi:MAG: phage holin family protein [Acidimicrobiia bacterium]|nr:phage holin family protein [Acidimicrobiia bacterium]
MPEQEKSVPAVLSELKDLTISYAKQETVDPIKGLGRFVGFGVGGSLILGLGLCLLALGALRALQTETDDTFAGNLSFVPYLVASVVLAVLATVAILQVKKDSTEADHR